MMDKALQLLGMARRAGKLAMGHDMAMDSVVNKKSSLILICSDSSHRLKNEFIRATQTYGGEIFVVEMTYTINVIHKAVGYKAGVLSVNDDGFAKRLTELLKEER